MRMSLSQFPICIILILRSKRTDHQCVHCKCVPSCCNNRMPSTIYTSLSLISVTYFFFLSYFFFFFVFALAFIFLDIPQDRLDTEINILHMNSYV